MAHAKTLLAGGAVFLTGYLIGSCQHKANPIPSLENKVMETVAPETKQRFFAFLKQYQGTAQEKEKQAGIDYFKGIWDTLPQETKTKIIKQVVGSQLQHHYENLKGQSSDMYEELKHYLEKKFGGKD